MADEKNQQQEEELTPVGPGSEETDVPDDEDVRTEAEASDESEDDEDERRAGHAEGEDEDVEERRKRRREQRHASKEKRREYHRRDQVELNFLRRRNEELERRQSSQDTRLTQTEVVTIEGRIAQVDDQIREAERIKAEAITKADGASAAEADRIREQLLDGKRQLESTRAQAIGAARQRQQQQQVPRIDPAVKARVDEFLSKNDDWFDPNLGNEDSLIAKAIEDGLFRERRLDPRSDDYWDEYQRRLEKRLPHLFNGSSDEEDDERPNGNGRERTGEKKRNGGPRMTTGGRERSLRKNEVYVSAERRKAMEEAGVWDDEVLRNRYLKQYQRYDREHGGRGRH
jgi:hypothetical protein